jgi:uncharacterized protein involved in copper resistance
MRWSPEPAIVRRDDLLARTRRVSLLVAGAATAASIGLATVLGLSIPGKAATTTGNQAPAPSPAPTPAGSHHGRAGHHGTSAKHGTGTKHGAKHGTKHAHLAPPTQPPSSSSAPPVTSSGGS